jgi:hypothetical protein
MPQYELYDNEGNQLTIPESLQSTRADFYFINSNTEFEFIKNQYNTSTSIRNIIIESTEIQYNTSTSIRNITIELGVDRLQRFNMFSQVVKLIWLMRARDKATNSKYIYWRSANVPGFSSINKDTILLNTVESVGSVYEEI